jgi:hypothetical protein
MIRCRGSRGKGHEVSDQDFFFDEEPAKKEKAADKPAKSGATKSTAKSAPLQSAPSKSAPAPVATPFFEQNVSMTVAGMLGVIGILVGVILGFLMGGMGGAANLPTDVSVTAPAATGSAPGKTAPALTPEQLQQGTTGTLPAGHPKIGGTGAPTTGTPAK